MSGPLASTSPAPWVLLRGLTRETRHWGAFLPVLQQAVAPTPVWVADLPGNGEYNQRRSPARVEVMVDAVRADLIERGVAPPYRLVAMSLGAMVATAWAQRYPQELQAMVLINTSLRPFNPFYQRLRPQAWLDVMWLACRWSGGDALATERRILRRTSGASAEHLSVLQDWWRWRRQRPVSAGNALRQLLAAARFRAARAAPAVSTLLLLGAADALVHPDCSRRLARQWQCDLAEHPRAGHDLPLDAPAWVASQIRDWVARQASCSAQASSA